MLFSRAMSLARLVSMPISLAASITVLPVSASALRRGLFVALDPQHVAVGGAKDGFPLATDTGGDFLHGLILADHGVERGGGDTCAGTQGGNSVDSLLN
jgi:hypothetical protein